MTNTGTYRIRPAGRLVLTIGRDLIQDSYAAVVELVKNAYDADSPDAQIAFKRDLKGSNYSITISDHGHGMTRLDVITKWLVPSTTDKLKRRRSPSGRVMQGRKGVGRYAASLLGSDLLLETTAMDGKQTTTYIDWNEFEHAQYLDDVDVLVETSDYLATPGTTLTITNSSDPTEHWQADDFNQLRFELKRLKSPAETTPAHDEFNIRLTVDGFPGVEDIDEVIEPFPIIDLFDYRITGTVSAQGTGRLTYSLQKIRNAPDHHIDFSHGSAAACGEIHFDIRVYDRDTESIDALILRDTGLTDPDGNYLGRLQARQLLNQYNGIGVYRHGFRIRPLGDPDFDWLQLNRRRVQNPSLRIGSNQVIGLVHIQSDDESGLIEKSARDGLKENKAFQSLKIIAHEVIGELEQRRFAFRRMSTQIQPTARIERQLDRIFSYAALKDGISSTLDKARIPHDTSAQIMKLVAEDQVQRTEAAQEIQQEVAVYQGQATMGKIVNAILHEGRRPLNYFRNEIPNLRYWYKAYQAKPDKTILHRILTIGNGIGHNAEYLVVLFRRIDPLAARRRTDKITVNLKDDISEAIDVFRAEMKSNNISVSVTCQDGLTHQAWRQDIYVVFTNLVDNSIYWMTRQDHGKKRISITVEDDGDMLKHIDYHDTGPGIDPELISTAVIFEPQFTTKPDGTGLGLALAGEAAARIGLELKALEYEKGVWFRLEKIDTETDA